MTNILMQVLFASEKYFAFLRSLLN